MSKGKRGRPPKQKYDRYIKDLLAGKKIIVTKTEYKALLPRLSELRRQGYIIVEITTYGEDEKVLALGPLILL